MDRSEEPCLLNIQSQDPVVDVQLLVLRHDLANPALLTSQPNQVADLIRSLNLTSKEINTIKQHLPDLNL